MATLMILTTLCLTQAIPETPFTLSLAFPTNYNMAKVVGGTEVTMEALEGFCHLEIFVEHKLPLLSIWPLKPRQLGGASRLVVLPLQLRRLCEEFCLPGGEGRLLP